MSARLSHRTNVHRDGTVDVVVTPNDGRYAETFRVRPGELCRFAWAILADFDADEAAAVAAENGHDLQELLALGAAVHRRTRHAADRPGRCYGPPRPGTKKRKILELLAEGPHTVEGLAGRLKDCVRPDALLYELRESGFVERRADSTKLWSLTEAGQAITPAHLRRIAS